MTGVQTCALPISEVLASAGIVDEATGTISTDDPLEQFRTVKAAEDSGG